MSRAYILIEGLGDYSDRLMKPVRVYLDRAKAEVVMTSLDEIYNRWKKRSMELNSSNYYWNPTSEAFKHERAETIAAYALLGFEGIDPDADWELIETELVS